MPSRKLAFDPILEARRQWVDHGWGDSANSMAAVTSVFRAQQIFLYRINSVLRPLGLTFARFEVLRLLSFSRNGSLPLSKVGARLQVHPTSVTNVVDRLEDHGLLRRVPHPSDRRTTLAEILPAGSAIVEKATEALNEAVFTDAGIGGADLEELVRILSRLRCAEGDFAVPEGDCAVPEGDFAVPEGDLAVPAVGG